MRADGVTLAPSGSAADDHAYLVTKGPGVAKKYGFHAEDEFLDEEAAPGGEEER